ncbi:uncharacterized protein LOC129727205 [Wyeomyia smithii]|uniref:uncharacterized protein LOC129727205 n=1 Tax=Wyeomyia smithii TaxID=174621 RepID=UPI002467F604|nr:uncharacterized protein LOC129727205 [Wyeomyia smithii]
MEHSGVPGRNPLVYCRFCLSQLNLLTVLDSVDTKDPSLQQTLQRLNSLTKVNLVTDDFPSAICGVCVAQLEAFHEFRRNVLRNHNAVRLFRRSNRDDFDVKPAKKKAKDEELDGVLIDIIDYDSQMEAKDNDSESFPMTHSKEQVHEVRDVDAYHVDGALKKLVVRKTSQVATGEAIGGKRVKNGNVKNADPITVISFRDAFPPPAEKRPQILPTRNSFLVVTCSHCNAVFRNRENLIIHMKNDHADKNFQQKIPSPKIMITPTKRSPQSNTDQNVQHMTLFKCPQCNSSFIQEDNFQEHMKSCKLTALAKLDKSQITIKRTKNIQKRRLFQNNLQSDRLHCTHCSSTYKSKHFLQKHLLETHNISCSDEVYYCEICQLNYSCAEDLKLHNQALHPLQQCGKCGEDISSCLHSQQSTRSVFYTNKVKTN